MIDCLLGRLIESAKGAEEERERKREVVTRSSPNHGLDARAINKSAASPATDEKKYTTNPTAIFDGCADVCYTFVSQ